jgi:multidrug resistance protein, MATE family
MLIGALAYWGLGLTAAWGLGIAGGAGGRGVWWGLTLGLASAALGLTMWFLRRVRRRVIAGAAG